MSYTPHTWVDNETITAAKLNNIEDGVQEAASSGGSIARVVVDYNNSGFEGSVVFYVCYARYVADISAYSIESPIADYYCTAPYQSKCYISVPLAPDGDALKPYIVWDWQLDSNQQYTITGDISTTKITALTRVSNSQWLSNNFLGFEIMGDGEIAILYVD